MDLNNIPEFYIEELKDITQSPIISASAFIERMIISLPEEIFVRLERHFFPRDREESSVLDDDKKLVLKGVKKREKSIFIFEGIKERVIVYREVEGKRNVFVFMTKPSKKLLKLLSNYNEIKVEETKYAVDFVCKDLKCTRYVFDTLVNHTHFFKLDYTKYTTSYRPKEFWKMHKGVGSRFSISGESNKLDAHLVIIKEFDDSLSRISPYRRETNIDRVRIAVWRSGTGGSRNKPLHEVIGKNFIKEEIDKAFGLRTLNQKKAQQPEFIKNEPLHRKVRILKAAGLKENQIFSKSTNRIRFLKDKLEKALENPEY